MPIALTFTGLVLVAMGIVYLRWPTLFRRGMWMRTSIAVRSFSEENYKRYMYVLGALSIVLGVGLIVITFAFRDHLETERGQLTVLLDPTITFERPLREGITPHATIDGIATEVDARREADGAVSVTVCSRMHDFRFVSQFTLRGEPGQVEVEVTSHSTHGGRTVYRWPSITLEGTMTLNHDRLRDLTGQPLILHSEVTGKRAGSERSEDLQIEITEADLR